MHKCATCLDLFSQEEELRIHRRKIHRKKRAQNSTQKPKSTVVPEWKKVAKMLKICDICGANVYNMTQHRKYYHMNEHILCKECGHVCISEYQFKCKSYENAVNCLKKSKIFSKSCFLGPKNNVLQNVNKVLKNVLSSPYILQNSEPKLFFRTF